MKWHEIKPGAISMSCSECPHIRGLLILYSCIPLECVLNIELSSIQWDSIEGPHARKLKSELSCL